MQPSDTRFFAARTARLALSGLALATLAACANFSGIEPTAKPLDAGTLGLKNLDASKDAEHVATDSDWWLGFGDSQLNALVQKALQDNPGLKTTQARLLRAQAASAFVKAADGVQMNAEADLTRQLFSANNIYPPPYGGSVLESGNLQATASWELDFFGKNQAALDAALGQTKATEADVQAARGLLAANVTRNYFQLVRLQAQLVRLLHPSQSSSGLTRQRPDACQADKDFRRTNVTVVPGQ